MADCMASTPVFVVVRTEAELPVIHAAAEM